MGLCFAYVALASHVPFEQSPLSSIDVSLSWVIVQENDTPHTTAIQKQLTSVLHGSTKLSKIYYHQRQARHHALMYSGALGNHSYSRRPPQTLKHKRTQWRLEKRTSCSHSESCGEQGHGETIGSFRQLLAIMQHLKKEC